MITGLVFKYCKGDISLIENYKEAVNSKEKWDCHHRLEIEINKTKQELIDMNLYYNRPASELIFLTHSDHAKLHSDNNQKMVQFSKEHNRKLSAAKKGKMCGENNPFFGKHHTEETKAKIREATKKQFAEKGVPFKGKHHTEETKRKLREVWAKRKALFDNSTDSN